MTFNCRFIVRASCALLISSFLVHAVPGHHDSYDRLTTIRLRRMSSDGVAYATKFYRSKMHKTRAVAGVLAAAAVAGVTWKFVSKSEQPPVQSGSVLAAATGCEAQLTEILDRITQNQAQPQGLLSPLSSISHSLKIAASLSMIGIVVTSSQRLFDVVSGSIVEALQRLWFGYEAWYVRLKESLRGGAQVVRNRLYDARQNAQTTTFEQALLAGRQQRNNEANAHQRLDIITDYQKLIRDLERFVGLLFVVKGSDDQMLQKDCALLMAAVDRVSESLECDLNEGMFGQMTYYSNKTYDWYYELAEMIEMFVASHPYEGPSSRDL